MSPPNAIICKAIEMLPADSPHLLWKGSQLKSGVNNPREASLTELPVGDEAAGQSHLKTHKGSFSLFLDLHQT